MIVPNLQMRKLAQQGQMSCSCFPFDLKAKPGLESRFSDLQLFFYSGLLLFKKKLFISMWNSLLGLTEIVLLCLMQNI